MSSLRSLLPRPGCPIQPAGIASGRDPVPVPYKLAPKPRKSAYACDACRKRKSKCDALQPSCSLCSRHGKKCSYTIRRPVSIVKRHSNPESTSCESFSDKHKRLALPAQVSEQTLLRALFPTQNSLEFELAVRHPVAYPVLFPIRIARLPLESLLRPAQAARIVQSDQSHICLSSSSSTISPASSGTSDAATHLPREPCLVTKESTTRRIGHILGCRLHQLDIQRWTTISITNALAIRILSLYLKNDYPVLPLFDAELFVDDLINVRPYFCSRFLVNSLLSWACQQFSPLHQEASVLSVQFFEYARSIWAVERHTNTLTAVAALQLLTMTAVANGREDLAAGSLRQGLSIGKSMGLFGNLAEVESAARWLDRVQDWESAASYTAWGVFNWVTLHSLHYQTADIGSPPLLPLPCEVEGHFNSDDDAAVAVRNHAQVFSASCRLWTIFHAVIWKYYCDKGIISLQQMSLPFAEEIYGNLLSWARDLPLSMARGDQCSHEIMMLHIYFHAIVIDLFRPIVASPYKCFNLRKFDTAHSTPAAVYAASVNQLKRLLVIYRVGFRDAAMSILWQTPVVYVLNNIIREATTLSMPSGAADRGECSFYMRLCFAGLADLYSSFRAFGPISKGLLGMAVQHGAITKGGAGRIMNELRKIDGHHHAIDDAVGLNRPTWVVDLDLAVTNPLAAQGANLVERLQKLTTDDENPYCLSRSKYSR